jgi:hypothetical protein
MAGSSALGMHLRLAADQGIPCAEGTVPIPRRINVGVASVRETDSNIETYSKRSH